MKQPREHWGSKLGLILATAGSAVGLGSVWRFPYMVGQNGGGAFVLLYVIFTALIGIPVFIAEVIIGRHTQKSAVLAYSELRPHSANWKMLGWLNVITCFLILAYYCVIAGWCTSYSLMSLNQFWTGKSPEEIRGAFDILSSSPDITIFWLFIYILLNVGIVYSGIRKGIEHWSRILMPAFLAILLALFFYAATLSGFGKAATYLFKPDFSNLTPSGILAALGMAFFTLSVGLGIILTYGSYMKESEDVPKMGLTVALLTTGISLITAQMIYPIIFSFGFSPEQGPGLLFKTMPVIFSQMPGSLLISTAFFLLVVFIALTSTVSLIEVLVANLIELFNFSRTKAVVLTGVGVFIVGLPCALSNTSVLFPEWAAIYGRNFFDTMDYLTASWMMPIAGLLTTLFVGYFMEKRMVKDEYLKGTTMKKFFGVWLFCVRYLAPAAVLIIIFQEIGLINFDKIANLFSRS